MKVHDPIGRVIRASYGLVDNLSTAVIDISSASGLALLNPKELKPLNATTFGTGELIKDALHRGVKKILLGVGGSATIDGGCGLLHALGVRFLDDIGKEMQVKPGNLIDIKSIDFADLLSITDRCEIIVLCDVKNKLLGKGGAVETFGSQKGATDNDIRLLEVGLSKLNEVLLKMFRRNMSAVKYGGAAGGAAGGLFAFFNARLEPGIDYFLSITEFKRALADTDLIITGEGSLDEQTMEGKGPLGVAMLAKEANIPVIALAGNIPLVIPDKLQYYFQSIFSIGNQSNDFEMSIKNTSKNLTRASLQLGNCLHLSKVLRNK